MFFALHHAGKVIAANYLIDLVMRGVPFEAISSVPAGHLIEINPQEHRLFLHRYFHLTSESQHSKFSLDAAAEGIRNQLELWFSRIAKQFGSRTIFVCMSGGLDSGVIAAYARRHFANVVAYTYGFRDTDQSESEDVTYAVNLAKFLGIRHRIVPACSENLISAVDAALCHGQDWRDFNVHCAIVNEILARAIEADLSESEREQALVLTGDMMNEFLADYTAVSYDGQEYYRLPKVDISTLRRILIRGLDSGDREIGIFNRHGLQVLQPYGFLLSNFLAIPPFLLVDAEFKQNLMREIAGDLLPSFIFGRGKVRAQIGNSKQPTGILPLMVDSGRHSQWMKRSFCQRFGIRDETYLNRFIRIGVYRFMHEFPKTNGGTSGYYS